MNWHTDVTALSDALVSHHHGFFYQKDADYKAVLRAFLTEGLTQDEKVIYIVDGGASEATLAFLESMDAEVPAYLRRRRLVVWDSEDVYRRKGYFDPEDGVARLRAEAERAAIEGCAGLRVTGDMRWILKGVLDVRQLIEYEARLNEFLVQASASGDGTYMALCQYDRRRFNSDVLLDVLRTHPTLVVDQDMYDNSYYMPPHELSAPYSESAQLQLCLDNLAERKRLRMLLERKSEVHGAIVEHRLPESLSTASEHRFRIVSDKRSV